MPSPLAPYATATLVFSVPTGPTAANALGSPATATIPLVCVAYLLSDKSYRSQPIPAGQEAGLAVEGYLISPTAMPAAIQAEQVAAATFWRVAPGQFRLPESFENLAAFQEFAAANSNRVAITGDFYWQAGLPAGFGVQQVVNDSIRGRFVARSSWSDAI